MLPSPIALAQSAKVWIVANGLWWAGSLAAHVVVLAAVLLALGKITSPPKEGEAPIFEARVDTEMAVPELDHFEVGETPVEQSCCAGLLGTMVRDLQPLNYRPLDRRYHHLLAAVSGKGRGC